MYYDLLSQLKNAAHTKKESMHMPFSQFDFAIAKVLMDAGYLKDVQKKSVGKKHMIDIVLKYEGKQALFSDFKLLSKPSRKIHIGYRELYPVKQGYGIAIISTPRGVMTGKNAKKEKVGGEYLFEVW